MSKELIAADEGPHLPKRLEPLVHYFKDNSPLELQPRQGKVDETPAGFNDLPLVMTGPGAGEVAGRVFDLAEEGLYRIFDVARNDMRQVIVYGDNIWRFVGHVASLHVHGWRQDKLTMEQLTERARVGRLSITCGTIANLTKYHLDALGVRSRRVGAMTLEDWNDYDNGHQLLEIFDPAEGRWILWDGDLGCRFRAEGRYLDLEQTCFVYRQGGTCELEFIARPAGDTYADAPLPELHTFYSFLFESVFRDLPAGQRWYGRIMHVPIIENAFTADNDAQAGRVNSYPGRDALNFLEHEGFRNRFYTT